MSKVMSSSDHMVRLMNLMNAFRAEKKQNFLEQDEERVLAYIYEREALGRCTTVSDLVVSRFFGTPPTVQRRVNQLSAKGLLVFSRSPSDLRKQCLHLSDSAIKYLEELSIFLSLS